jgi:phospholipase C
MANLNQIEHVVVLMLENRSFDNVLGWLYDPANASPFNREPPANFEGLYGRDLANTWSKGVVPVAKGQQPTDPYPDPGEPYQDVYEQLYNVPATTLNLTPLPPATAPTMQGFVKNYASRNPANPEIIMNCFTPATLPVLSSLAYHYGVCDHWFCSIPSQTLCNRSFVHAGTSSGYVNNEGSSRLFVNNTPTIFNLLSAAGRSWKVYTAGWTVTSLVMLTQDKVWEDALRPDRFCFLQDFEKDAKKPGGLPNYSYIEPNYMDSLRWGPESDMHPESHSFELFGISNVQEGEKLAYRVYSAVRNSPDWEKTLLLILFDEHGGCYDHVAPPGTVSPGGVVIEKSSPGGSGFGFDRLGLRVPAVVVSPFTQPGTLNDRFDHTSVLRTVMSCFGLGKTGLGDRAASANDLSCAITLGAPRADFPPIPQPEGTTGVIEETAALSRWLMHAAQKPITDLHRSALEGIAQRLDRQDLAAKAQQATSVFDAEAIAIKLEAEICLRRRT